MAQKRTSAARAKVHKPASAREEAKREQAKTKEREEKARDRERRYEALDNAREAKANPEAAAEERDGFRTGITVAGVVVIVVIVLCVILSQVDFSSLAADSGSDSGSSDSSAASQTIAATVNGVEIYEEDITTDIESTRTYYGYDSDEDWAEYLIDAGYTVESLREEAIETYIEEELLSQAYEEYGVEVTDEDLEAEWDEMVSYYGDEETFEAIIETYYGYDKETYLTLLEDDLLADALTEAVAPARDVADEDVLATINDDLDTYGTSKRADYILISVDDTSDASELAGGLVQATHAYEAIVSGELTFEEAYEVYTEEASYDVDALEDPSADPLDLGWDCLTSLDDDVQEALDALEVGEMSEPVLGSDGYYILVCTDTYDAGDEETDIANVPDEIVASITETLSSDQISSDYDEWYEEYYAAAEIIIADMPDDLSYYVDLSLYETDDEEDETDTE